MTGLRNEKKAEQREQKQACVKESREGGDQRKLTHSRTQGKGEAGTARLNADDTTLCIIM